ncbi:MAG: glycosyl hydrolase [Marinilabiliales bacterium]|nr:MAG: glycosyl hydrolase [Marinilabiliales bacterium]
MKRILLIILLLSIYVFVNAQYENILISNTAGPNEPSISMDPNNPMHLVAGANTDKYFISNDGGYSWTSGILTSPGYQVWGDPCIIVDTAGDFYFFHLSFASGGPWIDRIYGQKYNFDSGDWSDGSYMGKNGDKAQDKEWAVVDSANNNIYVTWTQFDEYGTGDPDKYSNIMFSKSTDAGDTWSEAVQINEVSGNCIDSDNTTEGAVPAVGPNGEIYVAWSGPAGIVFDKSLDQGETWLENDIFVSEQPGGWDYDIPGISRCNGLPVTCCDISYTETRGNIYVNWTDQRNGEDDTDVWIAKSTDGGETWSDAIRVNDDEAGKHQFFTWMTIDQTNGDVILVFYDRRNHDGTGTDVYIARSQDGGETFENMLVSESEFYPSSAVFFGDYNNITAHDGQVRPIWIRADGTSRSLYTAIVDFTVDIPENKELIPFSLSQNYPNPFNESTFIKFKLIENQNIDLRVMDIYGRTVANVIDDRVYEIGKYEIQFSPDEYNLINGVYYFVLSSAKGSVTKKMLLVD